MKIIGIIPARYGSSRFPGKPLAIIHGKSMIQRVYEQAQKASRLHEVWVATDDARIKKAVEDFGGNVLLTATTHQNGTERCAEAMRLLSTNADAAVNIQGDEPYIDPGQINELGKILSKPEVEIATLVIPCKYSSELENPNRVKVVLNHQNEALYFSRSLIPHQHNKSDITYYRHVGLYGYKSATLQKLVGLSPAPPELSESLEQLRWLYHGYRITCGFTQHAAISVDTPEDLNTLSAMIESNKH